jgi:hypothetical protein
MKLLERIDKKYRYLINAAALTVYVYFASVVFWNSSFYSRVGFGLLLVLVGVFFVHYPNIKFKNVLYVLVLPSYVLGSMLLSLKYFPNLAYVFKILLMLGSFGLFYLVTLVDNVFLVVNDREEAIPLYRAALPWSQVLLVTVAVPLFAGIFKISVTSFLQAGALCIFSIILSIYHFWAIRYEDRMLPIGVGGIALFSGLIGFAVGFVSLAVAFIPTESFIRALLSVSVLMFGLVYTHSYLKNSIDKKTLAAYTFIVVIFILLSILFQAS